jgi:hypothetical protein
MQQQCQNLSGFLRYRFAGWNLSPAGVAEAPDDGYRKRGAAGQSPAGSGTTPHLPINWLSTMIEIM